MNSVVRKTLFWSFITIFLIVAPIVVLYTAGFRFDPSRGRIERTGVLSISTIPKGAELLIDGDPHSARTDTVVKNLAPRDYEISLLKEGFFSWTKIVNVESQTTTFVESIVLFADAEPELQEVKSTVTLVDPTKSHLASLEPSGAWTEVWVENLLNRERTLVARFAGSRVEDIGMLWSPNGAMLLLSNDSSEILAVSMDGKTRISITDAIPFSITGIWWDEGLEQSLVLTSITKTFGLEPPNEQLTEILDQEAETLLTINENLYYTESDKQNTYVIKRNGNDTEPIAILPLGSYQFSESRLPYLLLQNNSRERIVLLDTKVRDQPILLNADATIFSWAPEDPRLLYSNGFETQIFSPIENKDILITRVSNPVSQASWHPAGSAIVLAHPDGIVAYDLGDDQRHAITRVNDARLVSELFIDDRGKTLHFLGSVNSEFGLYRQTIR